MCATHTTHSENLGGIILESSPPSDLRHSHRNTKLFIISIGNPNQSNASEELRQR
jgi:hypothetical protein